MELFFYVTDLLLPVMMTLLGYVFLKRPPKNINIFYGYRTSRSMRNMDSWIYAHQRCGKLWIKLGPILFFLILLSKLLIPLDEEILSLIHMAILIFSLFATIVVVEKNLKRKFDGT
ncbi:MAG: SdpI family protein [Clostridiaceae bacterium]